MTKGLAGGWEEERVWMTPAVSNLLFTGSESTASGNRSKALGTHLENQSLTPRGKGRRTRRRTRRKRGRSEERRLVLSGRKK